MNHLLNICNINGAEVEPVDIITFGSPCQDMSVAGKREGMKHSEQGDEETTRSGLFYEAIRIIKEMRESTNGEYPKYAVWENVPGAFSSNKGRDFHAVLEALCSVCDEVVSIPQPPNGKWINAGEIVGDGYSIAWRTLNAQYWGVPQRRRRIYLVADFTSECAGKILFEQDGVRGDSTQSATQREGIAEDAGRGVGGSCAFGETGIGYWQNGIQCLRAEGENRPSRPSNVVCFQQNQREEVRLLGEQSGTVSANAGAHQTNYLAYPLDGICRTLEARHDSSFCVDRGQNVIALQANGIDRAIPINDKATRHNGGGDTRRNDGAGNGLGVGKENDPSPTVTAADRHAVCYDARGNGDGETACTITGDHQNRITDYTAVAVQETLCFDETQITSPTNGNNPKWNEPSHPLASTARPPTVIVKKPPRRYIIRRLMPVECARLQGFPDQWGELAPYDPADAEFWEHVRKTHAEISGKKYKPTKNLKKWYEGLHTDSAEYKMWGNGIALPNAKYVLRGIAEQGAKTLGSLFDGSGGFPLAGVMNGIKPLWASEVEPYPIAVTKSRFKEAHNGK